MNNNNKKVEMWIAVGAPFLGAPKAVRGTVTGDRLGLDTFINETEGLLWGRSLGSTPWLFPNSKLVYPNDNYEPIMARTEETLRSNNPIYRAVSLQQILVESGASNCKNWHENYYLNNPLYGKAMGYETVLSAPPIDKIIHIYGVNVETEVMTFIKKDNETLVTPFIVDLAAKDPNGYYTVKDGIAYETANTRQRIADLLGQKEVFISGDGTVPYASLAYCKYWNGVDNLQVECRELEGEKHREILNSNTFFSVLLGYLMTLKGINSPSTVIYPPSVMQPEALAHWKNVSATLKSSPSSPSLCSRDPLTVNYQQNNQTNYQQVQYGYQAQYSASGYTTAPVASSYSQPQFTPPPLPSYSSNPDIHHSGNSLTSSNSYITPPPTNYTANPAMDPHSFIQQYSSYGSSQHSYSNPELVNAYQTPYANTPYQTPVNYVQYPQTTQPQTQPPFQGQPQYYSQPPPNNNNNGYY